MFSSSTKVPQAAPANQRHGKNKTHRESERKWSRVVYTTATTKIRKIPTSLLPHFSTAKSTVMDPFIIPSSSLLSTVPPTSPIIPFSTPPSAPAFQPEEDFDQLEEEEQEEDEEEEDDISFQQNTPRLNPGSAAQPSSSIPQSSRRSRMSTAYKLQEVLDLLNRRGWSFQDFIRAWVGARPRGSGGRGGPRERIDDLPNRTYRTSELRTQALDKLVSELVEEGFVTPFTSDSVQSVRATIVREIDYLVTSSPEYFGKFDNTFIDSMAMEQMDFTLGCNAVEEFAPNWYSFILSLLGNQRSHRPAGYKSARVDLSLGKKVFLITCIVCHSRKKKTSNMFHVLFGMYMLSTGTKRRVIQCLHGLGICPSYAQLNTVSEKVAEICKVFKFPGVPQGSLTN